MARQYRQITARFWTGRTGVRLRKQSPATRCVAFYLMTAPTSHMTGLYSITPDAIAGDLGIRRGRVVKALGWLCDDGFCRWDDEFSIVWVVSMAREQIGASLGARDNRSAAMLEQLREHKHSPLAREFVGHYWEAFAFAEIATAGELDAALLPREFSGSSGSPESPRSPESSGADDPGDPQGSGDPGVASDGGPGGGEPLRSPLPGPSASPSEAPCQAPSKPLAKALGEPLRSQRAENRDQGTGNREQEVRESERADHAAVSRGRGCAELGSLSGSSVPVVPGPAGVAVGSTDDALLAFAEPVPSDHPRREAFVAALWAYQNQLRARVDASQPAVPAEALPGGNWDPVRQALARYSPAELACALDNAAVEAECKRERDEDPLEYFNGETNWKSSQLRRLLATTPDAIRKRYRRKSSRSGRDGPTDRPRGPAQPSPPEAYAGGRVEL